MKFPRLLCSVTLLLLMQLTAVFAQADKIYIDFNQINIGNDFSLLYYDVAENELSEVVPSSNYVSSNQHTVVYHGCSTSTLGNSIEIISNNPDGIVCDNQQQTTFTVSSSLVDYEYQFYINGISIQGPSNLTTLTYTISSGSSVTVVAYPSVTNLCSQTKSIFQEYYELQAGSISGGEIICNGDVPSQITSFSSAQINGSPLTSTSTLFRYQWESSFDGMVWNDILGANNENYLPPSLTQTTYFRRKVQSTVNSLCYKVSNQVEISVLPPILAGTIEQADQFFCLGETLSSLTVTNSIVDVNFQYQWQQSTSAGATYTNINGEVNESYTPSNLNTTTLFRRAIFSTAGSGCVSYTFPITLTFVDLNQGSLDTSQNTNICYNETPAKISNGITGENATTNIGTISYAWQESLDNLNWSLIPGADQSSYSPPALLQSTYFRRVAINQQGSFSCSKTTNAILISVYDEIIAGTLNNDQVICEGEVPSPLRLIGTTPNTGVSYQWQMSSDNVNYNNVSNTLSELSFNASSPWYPTTTTFYRAIISSSTSPSCEVISNAVEVFVAPAAEVVQLTGPGPDQMVCPGFSIVEATFSASGSATTLSISDLTGTGLTFTGSSTGVYTLSGTPTSDIAISITANGINPCMDTSFQYSIFMNPLPSQPDFIRINTNLATSTIFQNNGLWYNNTLCQNTSGATTRFYVYELSTGTDTISYEWKVEPISAGTINSSTGEMVWNPAFSGTATISVRSQDCTGNSPWLDTQIQIIPDSNPTVTASNLTTPAALNLLLGEESTGIVPECQISSITSNTQFFATTANGTSDYQSIRWSIENIVPGGGLLGESNPGSIDPSTGVVNWNPNFYGSLDIKAEAVNCDGNVDASSITTVQLLASDNVLPNILTVSPTIIPNCPPQGNYTTSLSSNREVDWSIDNNNAGIIQTTATNTANMVWTDNFSGTVRISASASGTCAVGESELIAIVPGPAGIQTLPGLGDVQLCEGDILQGIPYTITGFPNTANVSGLPNGITGTLSATHHIVDIQYVGIPVAGQVYGLEILGQLYQYTIQAGDTADDIVIGLSNSVSALPTSLFLATRNSTNTLRLRPKIAGVVLTGTAYFITGFVSGTIQTISTPQREYIISGTLNNVNPGQYDYTITTEGGAPFCQQESIIGRITVTGVSSLTLDGGSLEEQTVCDFNSISPIHYAINNANGVVVSGLPPGVTYIASSTQVIISGSPQLNTTTRTVYTYTVSTTNNISGCFPEASKTGTITIEPNHRIALTSNLGTDNQSLCYSNGYGNIIPIEYTFGGGAIQPPTISGTLPTGIVSSYDAVSKTLTISGTPTTVVATSTIFNYGINTLGPNCSSVTLSGTIILNPGPTINPMGANDDQVVCDFGTITPINYTVDNANLVEVSGLPPGVNFLANSNQVTITGSPQLNTVTRTVYTYTIRAVRIDASCSPEVTRMGTMTIEPNHRIQLTSAPGTNNQVICNDGTVGNFTPIEYTFGGGATQPPIITGSLPAGIVSIYDAVNNTLTISGTPTTAISTLTTYNYSVTTAGPSCSSITLSGTIVVRPNLSINLLTAQITTDQIGNFSICNGTPIQNIQYELFESPSFTISGLPNGVSANQSGNTITIEGTPNVTINSSQIYTYTLTTNGSICQPEVSVTGQIEVTPVPQINVAYINANDITHVQCSGSSNGSINIPSASPDLDLRIQGGQSPIAQVEEISLFHSPLLGDEYRITINGIDYDHTVIASSFGGPVQTVAEVRDEIVNAINVATGANESVVTASANSTSSIRLRADVAGTPFTVGVNLQTTYTGVNTPTIVTSQIIANLTTNYIYHWTGPNGFSSSSLQIKNLSAGDYTLRVTAGSCFSEETFTIIEPDPITAVNELCNGAFKTTLSGGTAPYSLRLLDAFGNLVRSDTTNSIFTYSNLTPGANYRLEVRDATCLIPQQFSVNIPFNLQFNAANVDLTHDFCQQTPNTGDGSIVLGTSSGNAFTGGSGNFSYRWSGPSGNFITRDIYNLIAGDYTVTVTDNELGCTRSETFTVASNSPLAIALSGTTVLNSNGEIELACANTASGVIEVNVTGGFGVYTYAWERNGVAIPNSNVNRLDNLSAGVYTLTVTDVPPGGIILSNLCQLSQDFTIVSPAPLTLEVDPDDVVQAECSGQLVTLPVSVAGGIPPYIIDLNGTSVTTSSPTYTFRDLDPATLGETVTITLSDQNSCNADPVSLSINLPNQHTFESNTTDIDCSQGVLGSIQLTATPPIADGTVLIVEWYGDALHYFDTWGNGSGLLEQINNPGTYTVSVSNQQGCVLYASSFDIEDTSGQQLQVEVLQEISSTSCNENEGRIDLGISNGYPPYSIEWQIQSNSNTWTLLPEFNNQAIVTGLSSGTYRAIVSDSSAQGSNTVDCSPNITTRSIELTDQRLAIEDLQIENAADLCGEVANGKISFGLINTLEKEGVSSTLTLSFTLDGVEPPNISFDEVRQRYEIEDIAPGIHQLMVLASTVSTTCQLMEDFTVEEQTNPLVFNGELNYALDICSSGVNIVVEPNDIMGGTPFEGNAPYDLHWSAFTNGATQTFFGTNIDNAQAGVYVLTITDANGCQHEPVFIEVVAPEFEPLSIQGTLMHPDSAQSSPVKVLPIRCEDNDGGSIGIEVVGGLRPFEINWFRQTTNTETSSVSYLPIPEFRNQTHMSGLEPANYKVEIQSLNEMCDGYASAYTFYEEIITVEQNPDLFIVSGPFIDADICAGNPGRIAVEVFNNNQGELFFYYNGEQVQVEDNPQVNEQTHTLLIDTPVENATLQIINEQGCSLTKELDIRIGEPNFTFTTPTLESSNLILARENIIFENISTVPYVRSEWDFGDFTPPISVLYTVTTTQVNYSYPVSGSYNVTLRIYNEAGCFLETSQQVAVGKGYSIIVPNVFSPNNDGINDLFRPLTTGLSTIRFSVYDQNGNLIYNENISEPDPSMNTGIMIQGWDGRNAPKSPFFIYTVEGVLYDGITTVERTGTFLLLR